MQKTYKLVAITTVLSLYAFVIYKFEHIPIAFHIIVIFCMFILNIKWSIKSENCPRCRDVSLQEYIPKELKNDSLVWIDIVGTVANVPVSSSYFEKKWYKCGKCTYNVPESEVQESKYGCFSTTASIGCVGYIWLVVILFFTTQQI